jgi:hypothetical protein
MNTGERNNMEKSRVMGALSAVVVCLGFISSSHATLTSVLGGQAIYDSDADLTWLVNANAAVGSAYDTYSPGSGLMNWADAKAWAASLDIDGVPGADGWRLPDSDTSCSAYNCTGSELGNLFYNVLGGTAGSSIATNHNSNYDLFTNVQSGLFQSGHYWTAVDYAPVPSNAWNFIMSTGYQSSDIKTNSIYAWAVQSGNAEVPVPAAVWLFGSGLLGLMGLGRQRRR